MGSPQARRVTARTLLSLLAIALTLLGAEQAAGQTPPDIQFTALSPANGGTVQLGPDEDVSYRWHIDWPGDIPASTVIVAVRTGMDPALAQGSTETHACPADNINCWVYTPNFSYGPPWGRTFYWQVRISGGGTSAESSVYSFRAISEADRRAPRVQALRGTARRGTIGRFRVRASDDRGAVRLRAEVRWGRHVVLRGRLALQAVAWARPVVFLTARPLNRRLPRGMYRFCVTAWDASGNSRRSCVGYRIR
jgi:hypothetical protein